MPRSPEESRALFDRWATTYADDLRRPGGPLEGYAESLEEAAGLLPIVAGARVLDVGVGTGAFGATLAARGARIWGVDPSERMLEQCRLAHPEFALSLGSFAPIPHDTGQFDATVSSFAFHEVPPAARPDACAEIARVTQPGGAVCLLDIMFASRGAVAEARRLIGPAWDDDEDYPLVGDLDGQLRVAGFVATRWRQTAPCHWAVVGRRRA
ncbi:MAG: methyltransferase domain-containing protein [Chloroflexota bacterium]|nr:methyltransferase domain-containing protein [Chloroflexota bacterium]